MNKYLEAYGHTYISVQWDCFINDEFPNKTTEERDKIANEITTIFR